MRKPTSTLFAKILSWFFLNLLLVVVALALFFAFQPQVDLHDFFGQQGSDRLRTAGMLIAHDLNQAPPEEWTEILARHGAIHGVDFVLVLRDGVIFSSTMKTLPKEVMLRSQDALRHKGSRPRMRRLPQLPGRDTEFNQKCQSEEVKNCPKSFLPHDRHGRRPHLIMHSKEPTRYWFGTKIPLLTDAEHRPMPGLLLAVSDSITGNGFFFDPLPWMVVAGAVLLISVLLWIPLVRNITKPLVRMTRAAEEIAKGNFNVSIHEPRADEIGRLAQ
ncbi:MAG: HAMP domain-containing protein, partial [Candidatus Electrothrix sp. AR1]|nr:HAMP domain-containing protein [Candidatus Electrothrix sp. AR1]